eukprot:Nk52_evm19s1485 gene=Nk52_evmTU19s1485
MFNDTDYGESVEGSGNIIKKAKTLQLLDLPNEMIEEILITLCDQALESAHRSFVDDLPLDRTSLIAARNLLVTCRYIYSFLYSNLQILKCTNYTGYLQELFRRERWKDLQKEVDDLYHFCPEWKGRRFLLYILKRFGRGLYARYLRYICFTKISPLPSKDALLSVIYLRLPMPVEEGFYYRISPVKRISSLFNQDLSFAATVDRIRNSAREADQKDSEEGVDDSMVVGIYSTVRREFFLFFTSVCTEGKDTTALVVPGALEKGAWVEALRLIYGMIPLVHVGKYDTSFDDFLFSAMTFNEIVLSGVPDIIYFFNEYLCDLVLSDSQNELIELNDVPYSVRDVLYRAKEDNGRVDVTHLRDHCRIMRILMACTAYATGQKKISQKILADCPLGKDMIDKADAYIDREGYLHIQFTVGNVHFGTIHDCNRRRLPWSVVEVTYHTYMTVPEPFAI